MLSVGGIRWQGGDTLLNLACLSTIDTSTRKKKMLFLHRLQFSGWGRNGEEGKKNKSKQDILYRKKNKINKGVYTDKHFQMMLLFYINAKNYHC